MKKKILLIICLLFLLVSCNKEVTLNEPHHLELPRDSKNIDLYYATHERKIIYNSYLDIECDDLDQCLNNIKSKLHEDEWVDYEHITNNNAYLTVRIKNSHLDDFIDKLKKIYEIKNYAKSTQDISLYYQDKNDLLLAYETELNRLIELYDEASISDLILINSRISEIEIEIKKIKSELNQYDSLIDYCAVQINLLPKTTTVTVPLGARIINALNSGFNSLIQFFQTLLIFLVTILPWLIIILPLAYITSYIIKKKMLIKKS